MDETIFTEQFVQRNPGNIQHARFLNTWNNTARLYTQMTEPEQGSVNEMGLTWDQYMDVKRAVVFGTQVYIPNHFMIKQNCYMQDGPENFLKMITLAKSVLPEEDYNVFQDVMEYNCHYSHSESILFAAVTGNADNAVKNQAVDVIAKM